MACVSLMLLLWPVDARCAHVNAFIILSHLSIIVSVVK